LCVSPLSGFKTQSSAYWIGYVLHNLREELQYSHVLIAVGINKEGKPYADLPSQL
jgi:hypothetical protein